MAAIAAVVLGAVAPASAQRVVVFGDSLSDTGNAGALTGNIVPNSPLQRWSNGLNWVDQLYGPTALGYKAGGFSGITVGNVDYAVGGALAGSGNPALGGVNPALGATGITDQIGLFAGLGGKFTAADTVTLWGGANNGLAALNAAAPTATSIAVAAVGAVGNEIGNVTTLIGPLGAKKIVVLNLPDLGATPSALNASAATGGLSVAGGSLFSATFNSGLASGLASVAALNPTVNIIQADIATLFKVLVANPAAFGFTNATSACLYKGGTACNGLVFADGYNPAMAVHPTEAANAYVARYVGLLSDASPALLQQARLSESQLYANEQITNAVYDRLTNFISGTYADRNGPYVELLGTYGTYDASGGRPELTLQLGGFRAGLDKKSGATLAGGSISVLDGSLTAGGLKSDLITYRFDAYGTALFGNAFISADAGIAGSSYSGISRATGIPTVSAKGKTAGYVVTASAEAGFVLNAGAFTIIPSGRATYYHAKLDGYDEAADLLAMSFADRETDAFMLGGKVRAVTPVGGLGLASTAFAEIGYETYVSTGGDGVTSSFIGNTALPTTVNPGDPNGPGIIGKVGVSSQVAKSTFLDFQYGISVHDAGGQTHSGDIRLKATY